MRDFGHADLLTPEAIGEPGQRTFRLQVRSGEETASLWLEKEQLAALAMGIRQLLEQTPSPDAPAEPAPASASEPLPNDPDVDFKIGRLSLGYDEDRQLALIFAYTVDDPDNAPPSFRCGISRGQCEAFAGQAEEVVKGGRPVCILCETPIEPDGHQCLRRNGHASHPVSLE